MKFKIIATRCYILRLKCTKFDFSRGSAPYPAGGAYSTPPGPLLDSKGSVSKGRGREEEKGEGVEKEKGKGMREGKGGRRSKGIFCPPPLLKSRFATD